MNTGATHQFFSTRWTSCRTDLSFLHLPMELHFNLYQMPSPLFLADRFLFHLATGCLPFQSWQTDSWVILIVVSCGHTLARVPTYMGGATWSKAKKLPGNPFKKNFIFLQRWHGQKQKNCQVILLKKTLFFFNTGRRRRCTPWPFAVYRAPAGCCLKV